MSLQALLEACIEDLEYNVSLWSVTRGRALECGRALAACGEGTIGIREAGRSSCHRGELERRPRRGGEEDYAARPRHFVAALRHGFFEVGRNVRLIARIPSKVLTCTFGW